MTRRKTSFSISLPSSKLTISHFYLQTIRYWHCWSWQYARRVSYGLRNAPSSPWSLCSSSGRASERGIRRSEGRLLIGTQNFFFVPRSWQDENIFLAIKIVIRVIIRVMEKNNFPAWCEIKNRLKKTIMGHRDKFRSQLIFSSLKMNKKFSV